jgi:hypothetical protein
VEYLIVGGFAVMKYGEPRYTKDMKESGVAPLLQKTFTKMDMALATSAPFETGGRE